MIFRLAGVEFFSQVTRTRFPFRYGIASMREVPHQFVRARVELKSGESVGLAAEGLPPKWFTKDPAPSFDEDLRDMREVIRRAAETACEIAREPIGFFDFWSELTRRQHGWAEARGHPPLLVNLGVSLCERAVLDALCRAAERPLHTLIRGGELGLRLGEVHADLANTEPSSWLTREPLSGVFVRHTIGLVDPLTAGDILDPERVDDGLPQDLESSIRAYGLRYFKIKLRGDDAVDIPRLAVLVSLLEREAGIDWWATLDGNENFSDFEAFRRFWDVLAAEPWFPSLQQRLLLVEQPVHRTHALAGTAEETLGNWPGRPPLIIDESDGLCGDLPRALALGYAGTSHKNCKGIVKGVAHACLLAQRRRRGDSGILTGEDLCNLGPVARLQDLAMMALLGIPHVERNGHHYFRGLSMWPDRWQTAVRARHPDLYRRHPDGFVCVDIREGRITLDSVNAAPFGCGVLLDPSGLENP